MGPHHTIAAVTVPPAGIGLKRTLSSLRSLLHELVHHVQRSNNLDLPCAAAYERQAYDL